MIANTICVKMEPVHMSKFNVIAMASSNVSFLVQRFHTWLNWEWETFFHSGYIMYVFIDLFYGYLFPE